MLKKTRAFFERKGVLEVDCPLASLKASIDPYIDLISILSQDGIRYLHSSPEYGMKRLLAEGIGDIFQLSHVFRKDEAGAWHNPEFTLLEWYRVGFSFEEMIQETLSLIGLFLGDLPKETISYREAFLKWAGLDPFTAPYDEVYKSAQECNPYPGIEKEDIDSLFNLILAERIEPHLGKERLTVLFGYPKGQAALAKLIKHDGHFVAARFEVYFQGIELANGYLELTDPKEQRLRLEQANQKRIALGKEPLPIDEHFLAALETGLPEVSGVAVGFDRLMMLRNKCSSLQEILPFSWSLA